MPPTRIPTTPPPGTDTFHYTTRILDTFRDLVFDDDDDPLPRVGQQEVDPVVFAHNRKTTGVPLTVRPEGALKYAGAQTVAQAMRLIGIEEKG